MKPPLGRPQGTRAARSTDRVWARTSMDLRDTRCAGNSGRAHALRAQRRCATGRDHVSGTVAKARRRGELGFGRRRRRDREQTRGAICAVRDGPAVRGWSTGSGATRRLYRDHVARRVRSNRWRLAVELRIGNRRLSRHGAVAHRTITLTFRARLAAAAAARGPASPSPRESARSHRVPGQQTGASRPRPDSAEPRASGPRQTNPTGSLGATVRPIRGPASTLTR